MILRHLKVTIIVKTFNIQLIFAEILTLDTKHLLLFSLLHTKI